MILLVDVYHTTAHTYIGSVQAPSLTVSGGMMCRDYPMLSVKTKSIDTPGRIESRAHSY